MIANFLKDFIYLSIYLFLDKGEGREKEKATSIWEKNINRLPLVCALTWDQARNPGMCPYWESNCQPFTLWDDTQPTEPH